MRPSAGVLATWQVQVLSFLLTALMVLLLLRLILVPIVGRERAGMKPLLLVTEPLFKAVRLVTPAVVPPIGVLALALVWLFVARVLLNVIAPAG